MTTIRVDAPAFRDLVRATAEVLENPTGDTVVIDSITLADLHAIVERWHPELLVRLHFQTSREVIDDLNP